MCQITDLPSVTNIFGLALTFSVFKEVSGRQNWYDSRIHSRDIVMIRRVMAWLEPFEGAHEKTEFYVSLLE